MNINIRFGKLTSTLVNIKIPPGRLTSRAEKDKVRKHIVARFAPLCTSIFPGESWHLRSRTSIFPRENSHHGRGKIKFGNISLLGLPPMNNEHQCSWGKLISTLVNINIPTGKLTSRKGKKVRKQIAAPSEHQILLWKTDIYACEHQYSQGKTDIKGGERYSWATYRC